MDVNTISSVYERNVANLVKEAIAQENSGDIGVYYAKKEALTLPVAGVRFPIRLQQSIASNGIIHRFSEKVNMNISENVQSQQFKRWFGDWQNDPVNASKVVNADGTPKVVYHGTNAEFTVFNSSNGTYWFSESRDYAESMAEERSGDVLMQAFLNVNMNAAQVLEEIVCDAMAEMNAFATEQMERVAGEVGRFLRDVQKAAQGTALEGGQKKNAPEGVKRSIEFENEASGEQRHDRMKANKQTVAQMETVASVPGYDGTLKASDLIQTVSDFFTALKMKSSEGSFCRSEA